MDLKFQIILTCTLLHFASIKCQQTGVKNGKGSCSEVYAENALLWQKINYLEERMSKMDRFAHPWNCAEIQSSDPSAQSGVYTIRPAGGRSMEVYCDMTTDGGGWLVFQRRQDGSVDFYRNWVDYQDGFGDIMGEFWLGNNKLHDISRLGDFELRIDMEDFEGNTAYAVYCQFSVAGACDNYRLSLGKYSGTAGDSLEFQNGSPFSTKDVDNDPDTRDCAEVFKGGWWFSLCRHCNLNGLYLGGVHQSYADGVNWRHFKGDYYSLKFSEMKIRPVE